MRSRYSRRSSHLLPTASAAAVDQQTGHSLGLVVFCWHVPRSYSHVDLFFSSLFFFCAAFRLRLPSFDSFLNSAWRSAWRTFDVSLSTLIPSIQARDCRFKKSLSLRFRVLRIVTWWDTLRLLTTVASSTHSVVKSKQDVRSNLTTRPDLSLGRGFLHLPGEQHPIPRLLHVGPVRGRQGRLPAERSAGVEFQRLDLRRRDVSGVRGLDLRHGRLVHVLPARHAVPGVLCNQCL